MVMDPGFRPARRAVHGDRSPVGPGPPGDHPGPPGQGDRRPADGPCRPGGPRDHGPGLHPRGRPHPQGGDAGGDRRVR